MNIPAFDPRLVPEVSDRGYLPQIPADRLTIQALTARFISPPLWQPEIKAESAFSSRPPAHAAVLIGIVDRPEPTVLLTQRTATLSTHAGQIAFPGGKVDRSDESAVDAALRETHEETGVSTDWIRVLGQLPLYTTGTNFLVTPVVAVIQPGFSLSRNAEEVDEIFEVPLSFLMNPQTHKRHEFAWDGNTRHWYSIPFQERQAQRVVERFIWGATAGMLRNLYHFLVA